MVPPVYASSKQSSLMAKSSGGGVVVVAATSQMNGTSNTAAIKTECEAKQQQQQQATVTDNDNDDDYAEYAEDSGNVMKSLKKTIGSDRSLDNNNNNTNNSNTSKTTTTANTNTNSASLDHNANAHDNADDDTDIDQEPQQEQEQECVLIDVETYRQLLDDCSQVKQTLVKLAELLGESGIDIAHLLAANHSDAHCSQQSSMALSFRDQSTQTD